MKQSSSLSHNLPYHTTNAFSKARTMLCSALQQSSLWRNRLARSAVNQKVGGLRIIFTVNAAGMLH